MNDAQQADTLTSRSGAPLHGGVTVPGDKSISHRAIMLGALAEGETVLTEASELRVKESDRIHAMAVALSAIGAQVTEQADGLRIVGQPDGLAGAATTQTNCATIVMSTSSSTLMIRSIFASCPKSRVVISL